jgi:hypothetical protein
VEEKSMKKKIIGILVGMIVIVATGITVAATLKNKMDIVSDSSEEEMGALGCGWYNPAGAWMRSDIDLFFTASSAGLGRYSIVCQGKTIDPKWYGMFPTAVDISDMYGEMVVTGKNTYDFSLIDYAIDASYGVVYQRVWSGTLVQSSQNHMEGDFTASFFSPDQDPFNDEPLYIFGPWLFSYERIPVVSSC